MASEPVNIRARLEASLPPAYQTRLEQVRGLAVEQERPTYLAGGPVRDLLLGRPVTDMDFVVVPRAAGEPPPAPRLARALAQMHGGEVTVHAAFGTATWRDPTGAAFDFATARTETYASPGALPVVTPALAIETDLYRRDFSCNAMAVRVDGEQLGELVDPYGGQADLAARVVRVLHPGSLLDDPTRVFRAVRYAQRLGFALAASTHSLLPLALPGVAALSGERLRHELEVIFREPDPPAVLARLQVVGGLAAAHPALQWGASESDDARGLAALPLPAWQWPQAAPLDSIYLALLLRQAGLPRAAAALERLSVSRPVYDAVTGALGICAAPPATVRPSDVVARLDTVSLTGVAAAYIVCPPARQQLDAYLARWRFVRSSLSGDDLVALGLTPGPRFKDILARLRAARLDGEVHDLAGERALARELAGLQ